jgi:hypothetical protein
VRRRRWLVLLVFALAVLLFAGFFFAFLLLASLFLLALFFRLLSRGALGCRPFGFRLRAWVGFLYIWVGLFLGLLEERRPGGEVAGVCGGGAEEDVLG